MAPPSKRGAPEDIADIRLRSRQDYLAKRQETQLLLLRRQVEEEAEEERRARESGKPLSKRELDDFRRNRETLQLATQHNNIDDGLTGYALPDADFSNKAEVLNRRRKESEYVTEDQIFEQDQTRKAKAQVPTSRVHQDDYDFVFDESQNIQFQPDVANRVNPEKAALQAQLDVAEHKARTIAEVRKSLPVYKERDKILEALRSNNILVLVGETGSGKSTQVPQYMYESGEYDGIIGITQPRRVAAMSVAQRVADEVGTRLGHEVGYAVRFEDKTTQDTKIKFLTDGLLLREIITDPLLSKYAAIMLDEAHERTVNTDILLAILKDLTQVRKDFRLLISSATMNAQKFSEYLFSAPIFMIAGRMFDVQTFYTSSPEANYLAAAITTTMQIHLSQPLPGDILVFLTGEDEITAAQQSIEETVRKLGSRITELTCLPLYSQLDSTEQQRVFEPTPPNSRKVVLSTPISETSITVPGVRFIIDCGLSKINQYNPVSGISALITEPISRAAAEQRKGRAGRVQAGSCFRLFTKHAMFNELPESTIPEILRADLTSTVLLLKAMGINDLIAFDFLDPPPAATLAASLETLYSLGAIDDTGKLSKLGRRMSEIPIDCMLSASILAASNYGVVLEILTISAMLTESAALFLRPKDKKLYADSARKRFTDSSDHTTLLKIYLEWEANEFSTIWCKENFLQYRCLSRARSVLDQMIALCDRIEVEVSSNPTDDVSIRKAVASGYFSNAARLQRDGRTYQTLKTKMTIQIHPSSVLRSIEPPKWILFHELVSTSSEFARHCMPLDPRWLHEVAPHFHKVKDLEKLGVDKKMPKERSKTSTAYNMPAVN
jgi:pre-mRNA-splicing factor ATP-dependent RNA helicase DHX16